MTPQAGEETDRVLVLGAGLVAGPLVRYLLENAGLRVTVATRTVSKAETIIDGHEGGVPVALDVQNVEQLRSLVADADLVVSLLPYAHHVQVAELCIDRRIPMVTTSYVSPQMQALDSAARKAEILVLNETGVDPGIDHMSAMRIIHNVQERGGTIAEFTSCCGGLPAPEAVTTPWGYKFSWSPRGVVMAARNAARYLLDGKRVDVPGPELFADVGAAKIDGVGDLEIYPNRDSLGYRERYGLEGVRTIFRGTFRYPGHCRTWKALVDLGYLDLEEHDLQSTTYGAFLAGMIGSAGKDVRSEAAARLSMDPAADPLERMDWLGLLGTDVIQDGRTTPLDVLAGRLLERLPYAEGERDMIVMQHRFLAEFPEGRTERITSTLVDFGIPGGDSSMARTVSLPAAVAVRYILEGRIKATGVHIPVMPTMYNPILMELERLGIRCTDSTEVIEPP
ncbi:MAG: saccharopine dehydrogenase NADP-binding domain-containing protein [Deltaproteobacteria bacterium]|nr:saccharopine dehydrogenase NADP-binding domain-containing protein [Deltaproteobacteria bacterium]